MKKCYYLVAALMLMGSTPILTGCIDNDEPAGIEELRGAKAELIKAHAAVKAAEVAYKEAEAAYRQAEVEGKLLENELLKINLRIAEANAKLAEAESAAEIAEIEKNKAVLEAERNAKIAEQNARQKEAENRYKAAEIAIEKAMMSLEIARMDFTVAQKTYVDQLCAQLRNAQEEVKTALDKRNKAEVAYQRALVDDGSKISTESKKITKLAELEVEVMKAQAEVDSKNKELAKDEENLATLKEIVPQDLVKFSEELQKDVDKLVMDFLVWEKDHYFVEDKALTTEKYNLDDEKTAAQAKVSTIKDVTFEVDESVPYWEWECGDLFKDKEGNFVTKKSLSDFVQPNVDGVDVDVMEYSLNKTTNYVKAEQALNNLKNQFQNWVNVDDANVWREIAQNESDIAEINKSIESTQKIWNDAVALYKSGDATGIFADAKNIEGYEAMKAQVDKMNAFVAEIQKQNEAIVEAGWKLEDAQTKQKDAIAIAEKERDAAIVESDRAVDIDVKKEQAVYDAKMKAKNDAIEQLAEAKEEKDKKAAQEALDKANKALEDYQKTDNYKHFIADPFGYKSELSGKLQEACDKKIKAAEDEFAKALTAAENVIKPAQAKVKEQQTALFKQYKEEGAAALEEFDFNSMLVKDEKGTAVQLLSEELEVWWENNVLGYHQDGEMTFDLGEVGQVLTDANSVLASTFEDYIYAPQVMEAKMYSDLDQTKCGDVVKMLSEKLWGAAFTGLTPVSQADIEKDMLKKNEGKELLPGAYISNVAKYGMLGSVMAKQKDVDLKKKQVNNDAKVAALYKQAEDALKALEADKKALQDAEDAVTLKLADNAAKKIKHEGEKDAKEQPVKSQYDYLQNIKNIVNVWISHASEKDYSDQEAVEAAVEAAEKAIEECKQDQVTLNAKLAAAQNTLKMWKEGKLTLTDVEKQALEDAEAELKAAQEEMNVEFTRLQTWLEKLGVEFDKDAYLK